MALGESEVAGEILFRAVSLKYYPTALSSIGARKVAGRFNRHNFSAIYLSLEPETALQEYWNGTIRPAVTIPVRLEAKRLIDIRVGTIGMPSHWQQWDCKWKDAREEFDNGNVKADCASWQCFDDVISSKLNGIIYPSQQRAGGTNVVLFPEHAVLGTWKYDPLDPLQEISDANPVSLPW